MLGHQRMSIIDWQPSNVVYIIESSMTCGALRSARRAAFDYPICTVSIDTEPPSTFIIIFSGDEADAQENGFEAAVGAQLFEEIGRAHV